MAICLVGITYSISYIYFVQPVKNSISVNEMIVFGAISYLSFFVYFILLKREVNEKQDTGNYNKYK